MERCALALLANRCLVHTKRGLVATSPSPPPPPPPPPPPSPLCRKKKHKPSGTRGHVGRVISPLFCCRKFPLFAWLTFATKSRRRSISGACRRGLMRRQAGAPGGWIKQEECALVNCHRGGTNNVGVCRRSSRSARFHPGSPGALTFSVETPGRCCRACVFPHAPPSADV